MDLVSLRKMAVRKVSYLLLKCVGPLVYVGQSLATLVPLIMGCVILIIGLVYEKHTTRDALFPSQIFDNVTVGR